MDLEESKAAEIVKLHAEKAELAKQVDALKREARSLSNVLEGREVTATSALTGWRSRASNVGMGSLVSADESDGGSDTSVLGRTWSERVKALTMQNVQLKALLDESDAKMMEMEEQAAANERERGDLQSSLGRVQQDYCR